MRYIIYACSPVETGSSRSSRKENTVIEPQYGFRNYFPVKLLFDVDTPRPHFIIVQQDSYRTQYATVEELKAAFRLVTRFLAHNPAYDHFTILSFHRGIWYQQNQQGFHAHLCVSYEPY
ncbi:unnamed protein product [Didymodactylos carnosus]|uniref:Uncharacterized protein n=1 Tax=Didymodactylos carnosus TaxID=1234261 RepID=A0A8S2DXY4_9BILA|nr:unnamed protein product [Didymodactylos carnosus]CAF3797808.1 unnamed protein product [Didymodactylos carnosus]